MHDDVLLACLILTHSMRIGISRELALWMLGKVECQFSWNALKLNEQVTHHHAFYEVEEWYLKVTPIG